MKKIFFFLVMMVFVCTETEPLKTERSCENYFLRAEGKNETTGQMNNTAFVEALINPKGKWLIYYVMGEAGIGIATCDKIIN